MELDDLDKLTIDATSRIFAAFVAEGSVTSKNVHKYMEYSGWLGRSLANGSSDWKTSKDFAESGGEVPFPTIVRG